MIWFKTSHYDTDIESVEVVRETDQCVFLAKSKYRSSERRAYKNGTFEQFWPTWQAAHGHLLKRTEASLIAARRALELAQAKHGNVKGMKQPVEVATAEE